MKQPKPRTRVINFEVTARFAKAARSPPKSYQELRYVHYGIVELNGKVKS